MKKLLLPLFFLFLTAQTGFAQHTYVSGELIIWLKDTQSIAHVLRKTPFPTQSERLSAHFNIHLLHFSSERTNEETALEWFQGLPEVQFSQYNYLVESRHLTTTLPNDPSFSAQWALNNTGQAGGLVDADIDAPEAWDLGTGGLSAHGDSIVIAVVDEGIDTLHQDLRFWLNSQEIPNNQLDDDKNGFVDDDRGWNFYDDDRYIPAKVHGTHVAGIAAAIGDNGTGIAGVNWDARILNIAGSSGNQARVVRAYSYAYDMRRRYDETAGREGAYVVVINSSFGVNNGDPANFPIWCALYDSMGQRGILNVVSTTNSQVNVDLTGDIPSTCPSPFVIAVTATDRQDKLHTSGYGKIHVDLGAPGVGILSTTPDNNYSQLTGTSMATPHVTGAVSLLHAVSGPVFQAWYKSFPDSMALILKDCILQSTDSLPSLQDSTLSGGRLNLHQSLLSMQAKEATLAECTPLWNIEAGMKTDSSFLLSWSQLQSHVSVLIRYREAGSPFWRWEQAVGTNRLLDSLATCQLYEIQLAGVCATDTSLFSRKVIIESEGCCRAPSASEVLGLTENEAYISWESVYAAKSYSLEYRPQDSLRWTSVAVNDTAYLLEQLASCTPYEYRLGILCDTGMSTYSPTRMFRTQGCGRCLEGNYCETRATDSQEEDWIESFQLDSLINVSGPNQGYGDFTAQSIRLKSGENYAFRLEPGFLGLTYSEYWRIWIDLNQDGDFLDSGELLYDGSITSDSVVTGVLSIPADLFSGPTRLRVSMQFLFAPDPCGNFQFGEVEDYCIDIDGRIKSADHQHFTNSFLIYPNPASNKLYVQAPAGDVTWEIRDLMGKRLLGGISQESHFEVGLEHLSQGVYIVAVRYRQASYVQKVIKME